MNVGNSYDFYKLIHDGIDVAKKVARELQKENLLGFKTDKEIITEENYDHEKADSALMSSVRVYSKSRTLLNLCTCYGVQDLHEIVNGLQSIVENTGADYPDLAAEIGIGTNFLRRNDFSSFYVKLHISNVPSTCGIYDARIDAYREVPIMDEKLEKIIKPELPQE